MEQQNYTNEPSYGYVPEEPAKKNRTLTIILVVIAVLLLLCCCCLVAGWFLGDPILEIINEIMYDLGLNVTTPVIVFI